jgi:tRNA threonylcarbamoyladenosine biosynthesis protein TsaB
MQILALDAALASCSVALVVDGALVASCAEAATRGQQSILAPMAKAVLQSQTPGVRLDAVGVTIGPGSFTGLRSAIALAHGLAAGICPVVGVTVAEALAEMVGALNGRTLWTVIDNRRGRVFLDIAGHLQACQLTDLPTPEGPVAIAGDAAIAVAAMLAGQGHDVMLTHARLPHAVAVAGVARRRLMGELQACEAMPIYVDAPEAKLPAGGLRPHPVG